MRRILLLLPLPAAILLGLWLRLPPLLAIAVVTQSDELRVPEAALAAPGQVWVVEKERLRRRAVETGASSAAGLSIRRGLAADEAVVLNPPPDLREGQAIRLAPPR